MRCFFLSNDLSSPEKLCLEMIPVSAPRFIIFMEQVSLKKFLLLGCGIFFGRYYGAPYSVSLSLITTDFFGVRLFL
tara:strand:+ start:254 stop:481 length:228 start_codon:yes stop_codon:yes gene_type:complete